MLAVHLTKIFERDFKQATKKHRNVDKLYDVMRRLASGEKLSVGYRDHTLKGNWHSYRECHIESDFLLIYKIEDETLYCVRLGSHDDLFGK